MAQYKSYFVMLLGINFNHKIIKSVNFRIDPLIAELEVLKYARRIQLNIMIHI